MTRETLIVGGFSGASDAAAPAGLALHEWNAGRPRLAAVLDLLDPTWFAWHEDRRVLYVAQSAAASLAAVAIPAGADSARVVDVVDLGSDEPVHLSVAPRGDALAVACFTGGDVVTVGLSGDGRFDGVRARVPLAGLAPDATRRNALQTAAEPHQAVFSPDGRTLLVADRAQDAVHLFDWRGGDIAHAGVVAQRPGSGPRHLAAHPRRDDVVYLANELDNTLAVLRRGADGLVPHHVQTTLRSDWFGDSAVGAILVDPDGTRVFVSNRVLSAGGGDALAVFDIAADPLAPRLEGWIPIGGSMPRFCGWLDDAGLALAAQRSDAVDIVADIDAALSGREQRIRVAHRAPACVDMVRL
ncbi:lactonase family protein [Microbacterium sp. gxy059]|uniref:lactonase family protein n=1 Tax=Microbacterium sp. gxy059 TaxID=2957199 RepID=UPI003D958FDF